MHNGASRANRLRTPVSVRTADFCGATMDSRSAAALAHRRLAVSAGRLSAVLARLLYATLAGGRPCCALTTIVEFISSVLPKPPASSLPHVLDPESDLVRAASPTITRLLATIVTDPDFEYTAVFALVTELVDLAARSCLDYAASLVTEFESVSPPFVGGELALGSDVLEDREFELECLAAILPRFASILLCP
ncbi:unnamed protein product [Closterium sp. NIES-53]